MVYAQVSLLSASSKPWHMGVSENGVDANPKMAISMGQLVFDRWEQQLPGTPTQFPIKPISQQPQQPPAQWHKHGPQQWSYGIHNHQSQTSQPRFNGWHLTQETVQFQWFPISPGKILKNIVKYDMIWHGEIWLNILSKIYIFESN